MRAAGRRTPATPGRRVSTKLPPSAILLYIHLLVSIAVILQKLNFVFRCVILVIFTCYTIFNSVLVSNTALRNDLSLFIVNIRERERVCVCVCLARGLGLKRDGLGWIAEMFVKTQGGHCDSFKGL